MCSKKLNSLLKFIKNKLASLSSDIYQHYALGVVITAFVYLVCNIFLNWWVSIISASLVTILVEVINEEIVDAFRSVKDYITTYIGLITVVIVVITTVYL